MKELIKIQSELKAPKNQFNKFGKYNYRSCEDILEGVKPILKETNCTLVITDEIINLGSRFYVKATVTIKSSDGAYETSTASAREPENQKGMNEAQITGSASSYARKYALNGLFCIDDTKDADSQDNTKQPAKKNFDKKKEIIFSLKKGLKAFSDNKFSIPELILMDSDNFEACDESKLQTYLNELTNKFNQLKK